MRSQGGKKALTHLGLLQNAEKCKDVTGKTLFTARLMIKTSRDNRGKAIFDVSKGPQPWERLL